eukprot:3385260-Prymnesium_polylepis.1
MAGAAGKKHVSLYARWWRPCLAAVVCRARVSPAARGVRRCLTHGHAPRRKLLTRTSSGSCRARPD